MNPHGYCPRDAICRDEYRCTFGELAALLALVTGYRIYERPLTLEEVDAILQSQEGYRVNKSLNKLIKRGFVNQGSGVLSALIVGAFGGNGHRARRKTFIPTPSALTRFPELEPEAKPGFVKVRVPRERPVLDRRRAG